MKLQGARLAITGASSGIGAAVALAFAGRGCKLALSARRGAALQEVAGQARGAGAAEVRTRVVDVTRDKDVHAWAAELREAWGALEVAVANAGVGHYGPFASMRPEHLDQLVQTNLLGVWRTAQALLPLLEEGRGQLIVVGSVAGRVPLPYLSTYCATKAALLAWTRSVRPELARRGIAVTLLAPGSTRTPFARGALREEGVKGSDLDEGIALSRGWSAGRVAQAMLRAAQRRPRELSLSLEGILGQWTSSFAPHLLAKAMERPMRPRQGRGGAGNWAFREP